MTEDKLLNQAELCGFDHACIIETDQLIFDSRFRQFCETNYCGNYDNNYSCPPACGTPEELKEKALKFSHALVLQTITPVKNIMDDEETKIIKHHHNEMTWNLIHKVEEELETYLPAMAGPCGLCSPWFDSRWHHFKIRELQKCDSLLFYMDNCPKWVIGYDGIIRII